MAGEYLKLIRERFADGGGPTDPVPWHLDDKATAYSFVNELGIRVPKFAKTRSAADALRKGRRFGGRFVVKQPNRHSTMGVYLLEPLGRGRYLDLFSLSERTATDLKPVGKAPDYWLAEQAVEPFVAGHAVPLDYKVYAFRGHVTHVVQIDRNTYPPRIAVFDGTFVPLEPGKDYRTNPDRWLLEGHVYPPNAHELLRIARDLSSRLDTRFVRVDLYDSIDGPVFGEFTFASGPDDIGMIEYSERILSALDAAVGGAASPPLAGFGSDVPSSKFQPPAQVLRRLSASAVYHDTRYAQAAIRYATDSSQLLALNIIGWLNGDGSRAFSIQSVIRRAGLDSTRLQEFFDEAMRYHRQRSEGNPWHQSRVAELRLMNGEREAISDLERLAADGYQHARKVLAAIQPGNKAPHQPQQA